MISFQSYKMKRSLFGLVGVILMFSCVSRSHLVEMNDPYKEIQGIKLKQNLTGISAEKNANVTGNRYYSVSFAYYLEIKKNELSTLSLEIKTQTPIRTDELDSVIFLNLGNEIIKIISSDSGLKKTGKTFDTSTSLSVASDDKKNVQTVTTTTENDSYQLMHHQYLIPENLWIPIVNTEKIQYRLYIGKEGIDVKLKSSDVTKLKEFFQRAIQLSEANRAPLPEGLKKW